MQPTDYQPPLGRWSHVWRYLLVTVISGFAWFEIAQWQAANRPLWFWADLVLGLACAVLVWWRRSHPVAVNVVVNVVTIVSATAGGPAILALMSLATRRRWREIVPIGALGMVTGLAQTAVMPVDPMWTVSIPFIAAIIGVTIGWGLYVGSRRELLATLRDRAKRAEAEQATRVDQARAAERARIAREMHDVMAHRISLVTMHAGALAYRDDLDAQQIKQTATTIQETSHQALAELRELLGVLREGPGDAEPEAPQPTASRIGSLIDEARAAGAHLDVDVRGDLDAISTTVGRTLYRVVQESLTNARKHAPHARVTVAITVDPGEGVTVTVTNPLAVGDPARADGAGLGLVGLTERVELAGGHLRHGVSGACFGLEAWLPWETPT